MKRLVILIALFAVAATGYAGLKVVGDGESRKFDPSAFPPPMQEAYKLMEVKCNNSSCHNLERTVVAITTGTAPVSNTPFDREAAKKYGIKMMRKPDSQVNKEEAKVIVDLMYFLIDEAKR